MQHLEPSIGINAKHKDACCTWGDFRDSFLLNWWKEDRPDPTTMEWREAAQYWREGLTGMEAESMVSRSVRGGR